MQSTAVMASTLKSEQKKEIDTDQMKILIKELLSELEQEKEALLEIKNKLDQFDLRDNFKNKTRAFINSQTELIGNLVLIFDNLYQFIDLSLQIDNLFTNLNKEFNSYEEFYQTNNHQFAKVCREIKVRFDSLGKMLSNISNVQKEQEKIRPKRDAIENLSNCVVQIKSAPFSYQRETRSEIDQMIAQVDKANEIHYAAIKRDINKAFEGLSLGSHAQECNASKETSTYSDTTISTKNQVDTMGKVPNLVLERSVQLVKIVDGLLFKQNVAIFGIALPHFVSSHSESYKLYSQLMLKNFETFKKSALELKSVSEKVVVESTNREQAGNELPGQLQPVARPDTSQSTIPMPSSPQNRPGLKLTRGSN